MRSALGWIGHEPQPAPARTSADGLAPGEHGNAREPRRQGACERQPMRPGQRAREHLLHQVVELWLARAQHPREHPAHVNDVAIDKQRCGPWLVAAQSAQQTHVLFPAGLASWPLRPREANNLAHLPRVSCSGNK